MKTTLNQIKAFKLSNYGLSNYSWEKLLSYLEKKESDDEPLSIITVLDSNDLYDALLCLRAVINQDREIRLYAVWCARQVQHLMADPCIKALDVAERFANGEATQEQLTSARAETKDAAVTSERVNLWAAGNAAKNAALNTVGNKAWEGAMNAALEAVRAATFAAWSTLEATAHADAESKQANQLRKVCAEIEILETEKL